MDTQTLVGSDQRTVNPRYIRDLLERPPRAVQWELFILFQIGEEPPEILTGPEALDKVPLPH